MSRNALITGASRGIGREIAITLAKEGCNVIINYNKSEEKAKELVKLIKEKYKVSAYEFKCDISNEKDADQLVEFAYSKLDKIDILINNAGICIDKEFSDRTVGDFLKTFSLNTFGAFYLSKKIGQKMYENKYGKIVNISSNNSINGFYPTTIDYDASKSALNSITKNLAIEFSPYVNVNAVAPGWIDTDMNKNVLTEDIKDLEAQRILKKRIGNAKDVANAVSFLVSDKADYIDGQVIIVDGGMF